MMMMMLMVGSQATPTALDKAVYFTAGGTESNGSLPPGFWLWSRAGCAKGISSRTYTRFEYGTTVTW